MKETDNCIIIIKDGQRSIIEPPCSGFGEFTTIWKDGRVLDVIKTERLRIK
ncbi:DUF3954 domain-containing protein [Alkalicoccobacillus plakortidis]|uniref:DUF3954 domain-containing protein n=1 Tax=Alkalicoccobacillus plakortidis TaxID=444060 RepID=A0ABT0XFD2_9BACI|nr:DUF3954 domain-containing protein [Alkalicoccobacillus plakortidis]MCM2674068.1 DUF3954 domain-containing protein [Alkalicoccobacillus plakortidis]